MNSRTLVGRTLLLVQDEPLIALDLQTMIEAAGATVIRCNTGEAVRVSKTPRLSAAVLDARPGSNDHRAIARVLKQRGVPFLFYSTHAPEEVTTVRGAPVVYKPERSEAIVDAVALLLRG